MGENNVAGQDIWKEKLQAIKEQLTEVPKKDSNHKPATIFRLPTIYHETTRHLYEPKMVSIGPYHHGKESLRAMEEHKLCALQNILDSNRNVTLNDYFEAVMSLEGRAHSCYNESVRMESPNFVTMLLLDACFIIDYFETLKSHENADNIYQVGWANIHLYSDLFLLENQIPFFVINALITIKNGSHYCSSNRPLLELFGGPFRRIFSTTPLPVPALTCDQIDHLLQLYYISMMSQQNIRSTGPQQNVDHRSVRLGHSNTGINISSASDLREAGITFKKKKNPSNMFDISFSNGTMEIPLLKIEDTHKVILWNLAAFEQSQIRSYTSQNLSSYLALMDSLINTEKDVSILERHGIVENYLQSNEDVAELFNHFAKSFVLDYGNHYYKKLFQDVKEYSKSRWHKNRARLKHDYFRNPWTTISFLAAAVLLILTAVQTYFSAKQSH